MKRTEFAQVGFIEPVLAGLKQGGVNLEPAIRRAGLELFDVSRSESYVPFPLYEKLIHQIGREQGIPNLATEFHERIHYSCCLEWGAMLATSPSMLSLCQKAERVPNIVFTNERMRVSMEGRRAKFEQWFIDPGSEQRTQLVHLNAALALNTFLLFLGRDWEPLEVHFQCDSAIDLSRFFPHAKRTKVYTSMPSTAVVLDATLMTKRFQGSSSVEGPSESEFSAPESIVDDVEILLRSMKPGSVPSIKQSAEMLATSERSLRRALAEESANYADLVDSWRCSEALQLINDSSLRIDDIAEILGYSNAPSFFRAFKRWTNYTPNRYRDLE